MKDQAAFKETLLCRVQARKAALRRRKKILTACTSFVLCLALLTLILLRPATVQATDLMRGIRPNQVAGEAPDDAFVTTQTDFALRLFQACSRQTAAQNTLVSPLSVMLALAMTANGAAGQTKTEMEAVLGMPIEELNAYLHSYVNQLPNARNAKIAIANSIWYKDDPSLHVQKEFLQTNADYYDAAAYQGPFDDSTLQDINNWTKENTNGMIDKAIDSIDSTAVMYLINALVFDARWQWPYLDGSKVLNNRTFTAYDGTEQKVTMMTQTEGIYLEDGLATGFIKHYEGGGYSFAALLPNEGVSIDDYVASLTAEGLQATLDGAVSAKVVASLPQFSYDYALDMSDVLKQMGMPTAFNGGNADFSTMGTCDAGNLFICGLLHKTRINVDSIGTRATTVSSVIVAPNSAPQGYVVKLDRPFVFLILDTATNIPIFIGTVLSIDQ
jgi:serpin B